MESISDLMKELDGADPETVRRIASEKHSLPVRLAMLGLASTRKAQRPLWWGYPPGVFISYKWEGNPMRELVTDLAGHVRQLGYRAFLDIENLDENADAYFQIPQFISSLQDCTFYVLLLTRLSVDLMTGREGKTSWIHDEYQHALRLQSRGRLIIVPVLLEAEATTEGFTLDKVIDLTSDKRAFGELDDILRPRPLPLDGLQTDELSRCVQEFDRLFLNERWEESALVLRRSNHLGHTFDHQFRCMLHSIYTADRVGLERALSLLHPVYGSWIVAHLYMGYCTEHGIPNRAIV